MPLKKKTARKKPKKLVKKKTAKKRVAKKRVVRKVIRKKAPRSKKILITKPKENVVGVITHYFPHVQAAVIKLKASLLVGDVIKIKGHTTDFTQQIASMQIDHVSVTEAKKGQEIGLLVSSRVRQHDKVCKV